jgi:hypothetical protein
MTLAAAGYGVWWLSTTRPELKAKVEEVFNAGSFHTLEIRYGADQIMQASRRELLKDNRHKFLEPSLKFVPYLLLDVKYIHPKNKTKEGVILWDLIDGEMVIDTKDWEKTHGFGDCILAGADPQEFKIINYLSSRNGRADREELSKALRVDNELLNAWIESCRRKKLVVQVGNYYRLHLDHPRMHTIPATRLGERLVTKPYRNATRLNRRFSLSQIEKLALAAFGYDFAIRKSTDIFLPVHCIVVQNPDGSTQITHWNALNGKRIASHFVNE